MKSNRITQALVVALAATALAACQKQPEDAASMAPPPMSEPLPPPAPMEPMAPDSAVTVTGVTVGSIAAADKSVTPADSFGTGDKIIVSVKTDGAASNVDVDAKLTYQDGQVAGTQSATLNTSGPETTNIEFTNANAWPKGNYTVDVTVDGKPAGTQRIEVK